MAEPARVLSPACRERVCEGCTGYSGDYDTYRCNCRCHGLVGLNPPGEWTPGAQRARPGKL